MSVFLRFIFFGSKIAHKSKKGDNVGLGIDLILFWILRAILCVYELSTPTLLLTFVVSLLLIFVASRVFIKIILSS